MTSPELSIVIPVYNEGPNIQPTLKGLSEHVTATNEILVVYDFDEDSTLPFAKEMAEQIPQLVLHKNEIGRGVLNAMRSGIDASKGSYVLITMADGSDDPAIVDDMVSRARNGAAVVSASRYMKGGKQIGGPKLKSLMSRVAGNVLHLVARIPTHDPTNNFKLYSRTFLDSVEIESVGGFELALELTVKAHNAGLTIVEVPTTWRDRTEGESNFKMRQWLPHYAKWFWSGLKGSSKRGRGANS